MGICIPTGRVGGRFYGRCHPPLSHGCRPIQFTQHLVAIRAVPPDLPAGCKGRHQMAKSSFRQRFSGACWIGRAPFFGWADRPRSPAGNHRCRGGCLYNARVPGDHRPACQLADQSGHGAAPVAGSLFCTGHGLGGAPASLAASLRPPRAAYTFASRASAMPRLPLHGKRRRYTIFAIPGTSPPACRLRIRGPALPMPASSYATPNRSALTTTWFRRPLSSPIMRP